MALRKELVLTRQPTTSGGELFQKRPTAEAQELCQYKSTNGDCNLNPGKKCEDLAGALSCQPLLKPVRGQTPEQVLFDTTNS